MMLSAMSLMSKRSEVMTVPSGMTATITSEAQMPALMKLAIFAAFASTRSSADASPTERLLRRWLAISASPMTATTAV